MSSHALTPFTNRLDSSSVDVSLTGYGVQCDPSTPEFEDQGEEAEPDRWLKFPVRVGPDGEHAYFAMCVPCEGGSVVLSEAALYRMVCHALVQRLPDEAFEKAVE